MRLTLVSIFLLVLFSCKAYAPQSAKKEAKNPSSKKIPERELLAEDEIMDFIIEDYKKQYKDLRVKEINDEGWHELTFYDKLDNNADQERVLSMVRIPNYTLEDPRENNPIKGDVNKDNVKDYLVRVVDEGGGGGGNVTLITYYLFLSVGDKYECSSIRSSGELSGCTNDYGFFVAEKIRNQQIEGEAHCYAEHDGRCCPSLIYSSIVTIEDGEMKHLLNKEIGPVEPKKNSND